MESMRGFRVLALVCVMGWQLTTTFFKMHCPSADPTDDVYKVPNPYASDGRHLYVLSDHPHLIKTVRNALSNSRRSLWVCCIVNTVSE